MPPKKEEVTPEVNEVAKETPATGSVAPVPASTPVPTSTDPSTARIAELENKVNSLLGYIENQQHISSQPKRVVEHSARVLFVEDRAVVAYGQAETKKVDGKEVITIPITLESKDGKKEEKVVDWVVLLNENPRFQCEILSQQATKTTKSQDIVPRLHRTVVADPMSAKNGSGFQSRDILLEHTQVTYVSKVKFLEGPWKDGEFELSNDAFNR